MGRPRAGGEPPDRRKFYCPLPACAEVLACRQGPGPTYVAAFGPQLTRRRAAELPIACLRYGGKWLAAVSGCLTWVPCRPPKRRLTPSDQSPAAPQNV
ncbi:hypothetical protein [Corynebacterium matruchotii]|uniref:hypothetical protein n=1 Tax=Corynebacterium matruchotii TaxID=43768 RepID=UPI003C72A38C